MRRVPDRWLLGAIVLVAVALRLVHLVQASVGDPFFAAPIIDARENWEQARALLSTGWLGHPEPYWKPPLYAYLLALLQLLFGDGPWPPRLLQVGLDAGSVLLIHAIGVRLGSRRAALGAAALTAASGPLVYFCGELVSASLVVALDLLVVHLALRALAAPSSRRWLVTGLCLGVGALARAELLLFAPVLALAALLGSGPTAPARRARHAAALVLGAAAMIAPATARNLVVGGEPVLISANGGINLRIGTDPRYRGMIGLRPGSEWERLTREPQAEGIFHSATGQSRFHARQAWRLWRSQPGRIAVHSIRKCALFWHGYELASNRDPYGARAWSTVVRVLLWRGLGVYFPFGLLAPAALLGMALCIRRRDGSWLPAALVATLMVTAMVFFVTSRFRAPALPVLALYACLFLEWLAQAWSAGHRREVVAASGTLLLLLGAVNRAGAFEADRAAYGRELAAEEHHYRGTILFDVERRFEAAEAELQQALAIDDRRASTWFNLGQARQARGDLAGAIAAMREVVRIGETAVGERYLIELAYRHIREVVTQSAGAPDAFARGVVCYFAASFDCAVAAWEADGDPAFLGRALLARARTRLRRPGDPASVAGALEDLTRAARDRPLDAGTQLLLGLALERVGDLAGADRAISRYRELEWPVGAFLRAVARGEEAGARGLERELIVLLARTAPRDPLLSPARARLSVP